MTLSSEPGRGTTVRLVLPRVGPERGQATRATAAAGGAGGRTILLVEDQPGLRALVSRVLTDEGYAVIEAADGAAAVAAGAAHDGQIDLLLTDVVMPGMSGPELQRRVRAGRPGLRFLYMSGYPERVAAAAEAFDARNFLAKPFTPEELLDRVRAALHPAGEEPAPGRG